MSAMLTLHREKATAEAGSAAPRMSVIGADMAGFCAKRPEQHLVGEPGLYWSVNPQAGSEGALVM
jgi:hypothetical protein